MKPLSECLLYTFVDTAFLQGRSPRDLAQQLCDGGSDLIQLRAKHLQPDEIRRLAEEIRPITQQAGVALVINDHFDLALQLGAEFCHLGQEDFFEAGYSHVFELPALGRSSVRSSAHSSKARRLSCPSSEVNALQALDPRPPGGDTPGVGLSSHAPAQAQRAVNAGAAYIAIGPVYVTGTKPDAKPVTLDYVRWAAAHVCLPWFAIGGINLQNLDQVTGAGARRVCVVSAILNSADVRRTCQRFKERLLSAR